MLAGSGTTEKATLYFHEGQTEPHRMGLPFRQVIIAILVKPARTSIEPDLIMKIKQKVDISIDSEHYGTYHGICGTNTIKKSICKVRTNNKYFTQQAMDR